MNELLENIIIAMLSIIIAMLSIIIGMKLVGRNDKENE